MLAFTDTKISKPELLAQLEAHRSADEIIKGRYWQGGKGCAVGCTIHGSDHRKYEPMFGIPAALAHLEDTIFEGLPISQARNWPLQFITAIRPGTDLSRIEWQFKVWLLTDSEHGVIRFAGDPAWGVRAAIDRVAGLYGRMVRGETVTDMEWITARSAAWSAGSAANNGARSAAWSAAWSAARSAAMSAARSAAESAARSAAWSAAESAAYEAMRDNLIELLEVAPCKPI